MEHCSRPDCTGHTRATEPFPALVGDHPFEPRALTYRERRLARVERLRGWADKREARSEAAFDAARKLADQIPFGQPILVGHHSEGRSRRDAARIDSSMRQGVEHERKAQEMRRRADNIERAADRAIYSDDPDALERLVEKIADIESECEAIKTYNAAVRKAGKATPEAIAALPDNLRADLDTVARYASFQLGKHGEFPAYALSNRRGNAARLRERLTRLGGISRHINAD